MKKKSIVSLLLCLGISSFASESKTAGQKPNIIVILADANTPNSACMPTSYGVDIMPLLSGTGTIDERPLYWHYPHYDESTPYSSAITTPINIPAEFVATKSGWKITLNDKASKKMKHNVINKDKKISYEEEDDDIDSFGPNILHGHLFRTGTKNQFLLCQRQGS